jgi:hypothetical protein
MKDLIDWLRARLDDDQREAEAQQRFDAWVDEQRGTNVEAIVVPPLSQLGSAGDPARVLAEVSAKRRILDYHVQLAAAAPNAWEEGVAHAEAAIAFVVRLLALPHADRPGFRDEWRP